MIVSFSDGVLDLYDGTLAAIDEIARLARGARSAKDMVDAVRKRASRRANPDDVTILAVRRNREQGTSRGLQDSAHQSPALAPVG
jgi:sigma-B regulation protein RsbU (phosphoserine phosphatase)